MFTILSTFLQKNYIKLYSYIPLADCKIKKPYLLERAGISSGTVVMLAVPYYTHICNTRERNLSAYAVSRDYHLFFRRLYDELLSLLQAHFPAAKFAAFADHSPIDEIHAAAASGLGVIGKNGLLLTEDYGSYIFLGEIITDLQISCKVQEVQTCTDCGACIKACPARIKNIDCLSALTQKKGTLTADEEKDILELNSVWGCDVCQAVCPYNKRALQSGSIYSPIPFFEDSAIAVLRTSDLNEMSDEEFSARAYSWRGKETILRNLKLFEKGDT